jgi:hypothetical protein
MATISFAEVMPGLHVLIWIFKLEKGISIMDPGTVANGSKSLAA